MRAVVVIAALAVAAWCGAIAEPLRKWTVGSWEVADHGKYCLASSPSLMSGKTSLMFSLGGDGMLVALLANQKWQMKGTSVNEVRLAVDEQQHGSYPTKVLAPTVVGVDLPTTLVPALQDGGRIALQFDRATYSFPLTYTRLGLAALQECFQGQSETASTAQSQSDADQAALPRNVPPVVKAETIKEESLSTTPLASDGGAFYKGATNGAEYAARAKDAIEAGAAPHTTGALSLPPKETVETAPAVEVVASPITSGLTPIQPSDQGPLNGAQNEARAEADENANAAPLAGPSPLDSPVSGGVFIGFLAILTLFMAVVVPSLRWAAANAKTAASRSLAEIQPSPLPSEAPTLGVDAESAPAPSPSSPSLHPSEAPRLATSESVPETGVAAAVPDGNRGLAVAAAVGAFIGVLAVEMVVLAIVWNATRYRVGGPIFLVPPVLAAMWAWRNVRSGAHKRAARAAMTAAQENLADLSRERRFKLVLLSLWAALYCAYWIIAHPYGYYFRESDAVAFVLWLVTPPLAAWGAWKALRWAAQGSHPMHWMERAEQAMVVMGQAALANDLRTLYAAIQAQTHALGELHVMDVDEAEFDKFLKGRGRVAWAFDPVLREVIEKKAEEANRAFWGR